jgi:hypothetical protein
MQDMKTEADELSNLTQSVLSGRPNRGLLIIPNVTLQLHSFRT